MCSLCPSKPSKSSSQEKHLTEGGQSLKRGDEQGKREGGKEGHGKPRPQVGSAPHIQNQQRGQSAGAERQEIKSGNDGQDYIRPFSWNSGILDSILRGKEPQEDREQRTDIKAASAALIPGLFHQERRHNTIGCRVCVRMTGRDILNAQSSAWHKPRSQDTSLLFSFVLLHFGKGDIRGQSEEDGVKQET